MEMYGKRIPWSRMDEDDTSNPSAGAIFNSSSDNAGESAMAMTTIFESDNPQVAHTRAKTTSSTSPDSPWTLSPLHPIAPPPPPLLHHCVASLRRHDGNVLSIAISRGHVFTGSESHRIRLWRHTDCLDRGYISTPSGQVRAILAFGSTVFTAHKDRRVRVWSVTFADGRTNYWKVATLPKRRKTPRLQLPLISTGEHHQHRQAVSCMAYNQQEGILYTGSWDKTVKAWSLSKGRCVDSFLAHDDVINSITVNQDDGFLFTASSDGSVKIWRRVCGEESHTLTMSLRFQPSPVNALALSSSCSSCFLYSGSSDGLINVWEKEGVSGRYNRAGFLHGHRFAVLCLATMERLVFSGSEDTTIRVWRRDGENCGVHCCVAVLEGHRGPVRCLAVCVEVEKVVRGALVYSASLDQMVKVWRMSGLWGDARRGGSAGDTMDATAVEEEKMPVEWEKWPVLSPSWVEGKLQRLH